MRRFASLLVAITLFAGACGGSSPSESGTGDAVEADPPAGGWTHDFVADALDGSTIDAGDFAGQDLVLWFWAPW